MCNNQTAVAAGQTILGAEIPGVLAHGVPVPENLLGEPVPGVLVLGVTALGVLVLEKVLGVLVLGVLVREEDPGNNFHYTINIRYWELFSILLEAVLNTGYFPDIAIFVI
jgi:hypothetical protein